MELPHRSLLLQENPTPCRSGRYTTTTTGNLTTQVRSTPIHNHFTINLEDQSLNRHGRIHQVNSPGECVPVYQLEYSNPDFIAQIKVRPTKQH